VLVSQTLENGVGKLCMAFEAAPSLSLDSFSLGISCVACDTLVDQSFRYRELRLKFLAQSLLRFSMVQNL
jgi:hypothetical protein